MNTCHLISSLKAAALGLFAAALLLAAGTAHAQTTFTFAGNLDGTSIVTISDNGGANTFQVYAGRYPVTVGAQSNVNVFCVDATHDVTFNQSYSVDATHAITQAAGTMQGNGTYNGGLASALTSADYNPINLSSVSAATRADEVAYLADTYLDSTTLTQTQFAAVQMTIWDIVQNGGGEWETGQFQVDQGTWDSYGPLLSGYLTQAQANSTYTSQTAVWVQADQGVLGSHPQNFVQIDPTPEASSLALFGVFGAGLAGLILLRRKKGFRL